MHQPWRHCCICQLMGSCNRQSSTFCPTPLAYIPLHEYSVCVCGCRCACVCVHMYMCIWVCAYMCMCLWASAWVVQIHSTDHTDSLFHIPWAALFLDKTGWSYIPFTINNNNTWHLCPINKQLSLLVLQQATLLVPTSNCMCNYEPNNQSMCNYETYNQSMCNYEPYTQPGKLFWFNLINWSEFVPHTLGGICLKMLPSVVNKWDLNTELCSLRTVVI